MTGKKKKKKKNSKFSNLLGNGLLLLIKALENFFAKDSHTINEIWVPLAGHLMIGTDPKLTNTQNNPSTI